MGRQIINTEGASTTIARRRILVLVVLVLVIVAVAAVAYFMHAGGLGVPAGAARTTSGAPVPKGT